MKPDFTNKDTPPPPPSLFIRGTAQATSQGLGGHWITLNSTYLNLGNMKKGAAFFLILLCSLSSYAQNKRRFYCTEFVSLGRSCLDYKTDLVDVPTKFSASELKLGVCLIKPISERFELRSRIGVGIKFRRRAAEFTPFGSQYSGTEEAMYKAIYSSADKLTAMGDYALAEGSIILHYNIPHTNWGAEIGFYGKPQSYQSSYGPLFNLTYTFNNKVSVFCGFTISLNSLARGTVVRSHFPNLHNKKIPVVAEDVPVVAEDGVDEIDEDAPVAADDDREEYRIDYHHNYSAKVYVVQAGIEYKLFKKLKGKE